MRRSLVCLLLAVWPSVSFAAEPLTLLLIHIIRQQSESAVEEAIGEMRALFAWMKFRSGSWKTIRV